MKGFSAMGAEWTSGIAPIADKPFSHTAYSFNALIPACQKMTEAIIARAGGAVDANQYVIPVQAPRPPATLELWLDQTRNPPRNPEREKPYWAIVDTFAEGLTEADSEKILSVCSQSFQYASNGVIKGGRAEFQTALKGAAYVKGSRLKKDRAQVRIYGDMAIVYDLGVPVPNHRDGKAALYIEKEADGLRIVRASFD